MLMNGLKIGLPAQRRAAMLWPVQEDLRRGMSDPVPLAIRNAPTALMKGIGYGRDYQYAHDFEEGTTGMECLPERLRDRRYYTPRGAGFEKEIVRRLEAIAEAKRGMRERAKGSVSNKDGS